MSTFWQDVRFGARALAKAPVFTLAAVVSLALGIGLNTTIFTLINAIFLNPLPVERVSELVAVYTTDSRNQTPLGNLIFTSFPNFEDYRDQNGVFMGLAAWSPPLGVSVGLGGEPQAATIELVTGNYFDLLGVKPRLGRWFRPDEDATPGQAPAAVITAAYWQRTFGADPDVIGRTFTINSQPFTVVGVAPEGFRGVNSIIGPDLWAPMMMHQGILPAQFANAVEDRRVLVFNVGGRLKPGVAIGQAEAELQTIGRALEQEYPEQNEGRNVALRPLTEATVFPGLRTPLLAGSLVLMTVVGLVLLIACSNVANLLLARAAARRQEIAVRQALGAGRLRLVRQMLTESLLLGLAGGAGGLLAAVWGRNILWASRPQVAGLALVEPALDWRVLVFALVTAIATGIVFGLAPAVRASRVGMVEALKEDTRTAGPGRRGVSLANALVVGQVALSLVALIAAGLFVRSIQAAYAIDPGFETERLAVFTINPAQRGLDQARAEQFYRDVRQRLAGMPGVQRVSWASNLPLFGGLLRTVSIEGRDQDADGSGVLTLTNNVDVGYFEAMDIALLRGRDFTDADREGSLGVAIINDTMARRFWPDEDAIGRRFRLYGFEDPLEVVGIVETVKYQTVGETPQPCLFLPLAQNYVDAANLYVRTAGAPASVVGAVRAAVREVDTEMPIPNVFTVGQIIDQSLWAARMTAGLLAVFGVLALVLASVGLYGILAYSVTRRQREIGLRMALGAAGRDVLGLVLRQGLTLVAVGVAIGLAAAAAVSRALATLLYGSPTDVASFGGAAVALVAVATVATLVPALRASRVDPLVALREG